MTVYKSTPRSTVYHWKYGEGPHRSRQDWSWMRTRRDRLRRERNEIWSECGRRLPDDPSVNMCAEEEELGSEQWCSGPGCNERWYRWERAQRARESDRATRAVEETRQRLVEVHERRDARGDAAGRPEGVRDLPGPGTRGGVAGGEGGGLPGPQDTGTVQGHLATYADGLNGIQVRLDAIGNAATAFATNTTLYWGGGSTTLTVRAPETCACGQPRDDLWEHSPEECTWRERV
jgi:hypothetical protein